MSTCKQDERAPQGRFRGDDGAVLVEFALMLPFFLVMSLGVIEFGFAWKQQISLRGTVRVGARQVTNLGDSRSADFFALQAIKAGLAEMRNTTIDYVSIYKTTASTGVPTNAACTPVATPTGVGGVSGACNIYSAAQINGLPNNPDGVFFQNDNATSCAGTAYDRFWCPISRNADQSDPPDYVGVHIRVTYSTLTRLVGTSIKFNDRMVMRIEPRID